MCINKKYNTGVFDTELIGIPTTNVKNKYGPKVADNVSFKKGEKTGENLTLFSSVNRAEQNFRLNASYFCVKPERTLLD